MKKKPHNEQETETVASGLPATRPTRDLAQVKCIYFLFSLLTSFCMKILSPLGTPKIFLRLGPKELRYLETMASTAYAKSNTVPETERALKKA